MEKASDIRIVMVTTDSLEIAKSIAKSIVDHNLAACCSIIPQVISVFEWEGKTEETAEFLMMIKTRKKSISDLEKKITEMHNYKVPEIIALSADSCNSSYLDWLNMTMNHKKIK